MEEISKEKVKNKGCGKAYNLKKQTVYIETKLKIELRGHYAPEPAWGTS